MATSARVLGAAAFGMLMLAAHCQVVDVFVGGETGGEAQYRIPALVRTGRGSLLLFAEARPYPTRDCNHKWIVAKRSTDNGATWSAEIDVVGKEWLGWSTGNVQPVFHAPSGRIVLTVGSKDLTKPDSECQPGTALFAVDDGGSDGTAWGPPRNITGVTGPLVPGPGSTLVLNLTHPGRIVGVGVNGGAYSSVATYWSDDAGLTWALSSSPVGPGMDESSMAELPDGRVYLSMRNAHFNASCQCQAYAISTDGGETFAPIQYDPTLISPECEASVATLNGTLYFANTASTTERANMTIRRTAANTSDPTAWVSSLLIAPGLTWGGYSSMARSPLNATHGGIAFERNDTAGDVISFTPFPLLF